MNFRHRENVEGKYIKYNLNISFLRSEEIKTFVENYNNIVSKIIENKKSNLSINTEIEELNKIKELIELGQLELPKNKNILKGSSFDDKRIGKGQDSLVYEFKNNSKYIYKEGKESSIENIEYLKNKYLGDIIPKSYFVLGEGFSKLWYRGLKGNLYISTKSLTIQKKVLGKDISKMSIREKNNPDFLKKLEKAHKKYVVLKLFLDTIIKDLQLPKKSMDLQLDLGSLSNRDNFHHDDIEFIESELKSPNIMWDGKNIYFIDYGFGEWDESKKSIFDELMKEETFKKWEELLKIYGID